jgi:hypothetical protein
VERLIGPAVALQRVSVEQIASLFGEGQAALVATKIDSLDKAFIAEVAERIVVCVEVLFGHDSERANGGESAVVLAVQLVDTIASDNELAFLAARQVEILHQKVARIVTVSVPLPVDAGAAIAAIQIVVLTGIVPSSVRHRPSFGAQLAPVGLSVKTPWQCLRGAVQGSAEAPGRVAAAINARSVGTLLAAIEANERGFGLRASAPPSTGSRPQNCYPMLYASEKRAASAAFRHRWSPDWEQTQPITHGVPAFAPARPQLSRSDGQRGSAARLC